MGKARCLIFLYRRAEALLHPVFYRDSCQVEAKCRCPCSSPEGTNENSPAACCRVPERTNLFRTAVGSRAVKRSADK